MRNKSLVVADGVTIAIQDGSPPKHLHADANEIQYILEGTGTIWLGDKEVTVKPGDLVVIPKGTPHAFRCMGPTPGRMLTTVVPGGLDDFFIEIETRGFKLPQDLEQLVALGKRYGHEFIGPPLGD